MSTLSIPPSTTATAPPIPTSPSQPPSHPNTTHQKLDKNSYSYIWRSLLAGGIAGCAAKTAVAPLDRVKILFQTNNPHFERHAGSFKGIFNAGAEIKRLYGVRGLFQGHSATLLRIFPYAAIKFMAYEQIKHRLGVGKAGVSHTEQAFRNMVAGSLAGCISVFFSYPLDLLRVRLAFEVRTTTAASQVPLQPVSLSSVVKMIYHEPNPFFAEDLAADGNGVERKGWSRVPGVLNFYRGFMPTIYGIVPYAGVSFLVYERLKTYAKTTLGRYTLVSPTPTSSTTPARPPQLTWWAYLACGALSGAIAQTTAYPFEVIRRNMQVAGVASKTPISTTTSQTSSTTSTKLAQRKTTLSTAKWIYGRKGFKGFFVGLSIGYLKVMPMSAVSFFTYEWGKGWLGIE
ncbi:mitochondrial carrier domain-containing protein [Fimicolochytrium jonesii]|uniref:mitochondrial carrier domain-containing protein n=1 Tax=Fimicolochytrium jonesii TaxID=1396493 RepID=UPI0022FEA80C|nr:mitochondrial carrier domain-containing protein [Fimicolochytrium jonesii]KAI8818887.1 mitochondrial carrier domain-containing protein [Fimicolochytrium jonesii]